MAENLFDRVAGLTPVKTYEPSGETLFDRVASIESYEPEYRRREAESVFDYIHNNHENEDADAIINLTDHFARQYGVSRENAYSNLDRYITDYMGKLTPKKIAWQQIQDGYKEGRLTDRIGILSNKMMMSKDENQRQRYQLEIEKLEQQMPSHMVDQGGVVGAVSSASNLFGTMIRPLGISVLTSLATAGLGTIPAVASFAKAYPLIAKVGSKILAAAPTFNETRKVETGLIYKDMIENGVPEEIAKKNAIAHGIIAGALETASIEVLLARFPFMKNIAKNAVLRMTARERMAQGAVKTIGKILADNAISIPIGVVSETATEIWQEQSAIYFEKRADLQSIDDEELAKIMADKYGEFERYFDEEYRKQKKDYYGSEEYAQQVKDRIWDVAKQTAQGMLVFGILGGGVNAVTDVTKVAKKDIPYRRTYKKFEDLKTDTDKLREQRDKLREEVNRDPANEEKKAKYEKIREELDAKERELNMTDDEKEYADLLNKWETEKGLSEEELDRLVDLDTKNQVRKAFREDTDPNYEKEPQDIEHPQPQTLDVGEKKLREIIKNVTPNVTEEQTDVILDLLNARARSMGWDLDTYLTNTFQMEMAQYSENDTTTIIRDGKEKTVRYKGNVGWAEDGKAIITLTRNADFTTWVHEIGHIFRKQIGGDMLTEAERYYEVKDGVWTEEQEERFTEDLTMYLRTRRAPNSTLEKMFRIIADGLNDIYNRFMGRKEVSDDIAKVFDQMLGDRQSAFNTQTNTTADYDPDGTLYQLLGEEGARMLDDLEQAHTRITNLETAKDMTAAGKSKKEIRIATGWELGSDGEWKYETVDPVYEFEINQGDIDDDALLPYGIVGKHKANIPESFYRRIISNPGKGIHTTLRELWGDDNPVVKAYPEFADKDIFFTPKKKKGELGNAGDDKITIRTVTGTDDFGKREMETVEKLSGTLLHEVQHWVQEKEGFAVGGDPDSFVPAGADYRKLVDKLKEYNDLVKEYKKADSNRRRDINHRLAILDVDIKELKKTLPRLGQSNYMLMAGEAEADNADIRRLMTEEERKNTTLEETEKQRFGEKSNISQEDYLVIKNGEIVENAIQKAIDALKTTQPSHQHLLFQPAFHGSGANFDEFSTDFIGTGEGAQAFGWGIYLTQSHGIAKSYAEKLRKGEIFVRNGVPLTKEETDFLEGLGIVAVNYRDYKFSEQAIQDHIQIEKDNIEESIEFLEERVYDEEQALNIMRKYKGISSDRRSLEQELKDNGLLGDAVFWITERGVNGFIDTKEKEYSDDVERLKEKRVLAETLEKFDATGLDVQQSKRNLYTVSIPDNTGNNYLYWDKVPTDEQREQIIKELKAYYNPVDNAQKKALRETVQDIKYDSFPIFPRNGEYIYKKLENLMGDKEASLFLNSIGYVGIDYPANATTGGNRYGKRNFVIFNDEDIHIENHKLYQLYQNEEDTYRVATENGNYVPDYILTNMIGKDWVEDELDAREDFRKDARNYDSFEAFLETQRKSGGLRSDKYYEQIWLTSESIIPEYEAMIPHLSRRMIERVLSTLNANVKYKRGAMPSGMLGEMVEKYAKKHMISEEEFRALKDELVSAPDKAITFISECFMNEDEFKEMMKSLWLHPDLEVERIKELERAIRSDQHLAQTRISQLEEKIKDIRRRYREREIYNKLVRAIFRKPAKMCDVEIAMQIQAIQAGLSPTSMREATRLKLELELQNTTDERRKAKIRNLMERKSLREMTLEEIAQIASMLTQMRHEGVQKRMEQLMAKQEERNGIIERLGEDIDVQINLDKTGSVEARKDKGDLVSRMKGFWWDINRIAEDMGPHWKAFFAERVSQAYEQELVNVARRRTNLMSEMERLGVTTEMLSKTEEIEGAAELLGEKKRTYTHDILLHWYLCKQNEDSYAALLFGNFRGDGDNPEKMMQIEKVIDDGISRLSDAEIELAEWMMNSFSGEDRGRLWEIFMSVENRCPEMVTRYFPMKKQLDHISDIQADPLVDLGERTPAGRVAVRKGFSWDRIHKIRWDHQKPLKLGAMSIYLQAIQDQEHYIAFAQLSKDMKYCYEKVADKVISKYGRNFYDDLSKWIDRVINPNAYKARYNEQNIFLDALSNSVAASLAGNVVTMIKQVPSMLFFLPYTDVASMAHSLHEFATHPKKMTEEVKEKSPYLKMRNMEDMLTKLKDQLADPNTKMRWAKQGMDALLKPISWMDEFACVVGWNSVYSHEISNGATEEEAVKKANDALLKTQPQAAAIFSPQAYNAGGFWRPFLVFTRQANQIFQMVTADFKHIWNSEAEDRFRQIIKMGFVLGLNAFIMGWISRKFAGYGDDDEGALKDASKDIIANLANNVPIVGPTLVGMMQRSAYTSSGYVNPMSDMLMKGYKAYNRVVDKKEMDFDTAMRLITDAMKPAGMPSVLTWRAYQALKEKDIWYLMIGAPLGGKNGRK